MPQQAEGVTDLDKALSAAREALGQRQQTAERQLQRALKNLPVARVRGAIAHAASQGCAAATLREAGAACRARDAEAARTLMEAAAADPFNGADYRAAFGRCASLDLGPARAAAAGIVAPRQANMRSQLYMAAASSPAAQLSGLFEEAEQLGLAAELQAAKEALQHRQHAAVAALEAAAARADAGAFASALSTVWLVNARDDEVRAAARLLESRLQQAAEQLPTSTDYDWRLQEHPRAGVTTEAIKTTSMSWEERGVSGNGEVLTSSQVASMLHGTKYGNVQHLNLGLERLSCFGSALAPFTSLVELYAQSNCLTSLSGLEGCKRLEVLKVSNNALATCKGLNRLTLLRDLDLNMNRITSLGGLQCCSALERLNLDDNKLFGLGGCLPSDALTWLSLANNSLTSIQGIEACGLLEHLSLQGNQVASLSGLQACTRLRHLDAGLNRLLEFPSNSLPLECLTHLSLHGNRFTHIPELPCMTSLEVLYLQDNQISAVQPMHRLPSLRLVNLSFNILADLATLTAFLPLSALAELYLNGNPLEKHSRYLEQRCRLLPHLEKDHNHARVPYEDLEARLTTHLVASPVSPIALLQWQTSGKGSPFQLSRVGTTTKSMVRDRAFSAPASADPWRCMQAHAQPGVMHHNMLAKRHWALSQRMAGLVQQRLQRAEAQRERSATTIQSAWRAHVRGRLAKVQDCAARARADTEDRAIRTIQAAVCGWRVRAEVRSAKQARQIAAQCDADVFPEEEEAELLLFADSAAKLFAAASRTATAWITAAEPTASSGETSEGGDQPTSRVDLAVPEREHLDVEPGNQGLFEHLPAEALLRSRGEFSMGAEQPETVAREASEDEDSVETWWRINGLDIADEDASSSGPSAVADSSRAVLDEVQLLNMPDPVHFNWDSNTQNALSTGSDELAKSLTVEAKSSTLADMNSEITHHMPRSSSRATKSSGSSACDRSASRGQSECSTSMHSACAVEGAAAGMPACEDSIEASGQPAEDGIPQQTGSLGHHGLQQPLSNKELRRQAAIGRGMEEWGFKDWATAETFYKSQQHHLRSTKDSQRRHLLQDPSVRLARIKSKVEAWAEGASKKETSMRRGSDRLQSSSTRRHSYATAYLRMQPQADHN